MKRHALAPLLLAAALLAGCGQSAPSSSPAAEEENATKEDIGARRLHTLFEKVLEDISFNAAGDMPDVEVLINGAYVAEHLGEDAKKMDLKRYIL